MKHSQILLSINGHAKEYLLVILHMWYILSSSSCHEQGTVKLNYIYTGGFLIWHMVIVEQGPCNSRK